MPAPLSRPLFRIAVALAAFGALAVAPLSAGPSPGEAAPSAAAAATETAPRWFDREGNPQPWRTDDEVEDFLARARITGSKVLDSGTTKPTRFDLELDGVRARAIFRTVEVDDVERSERSRVPIGAMRDSWIHEIAAWRLARLLGLDAVPPTVERRIEGDRGSLQLWVEGARSEAERIAAGEAPRFPASWSRQRQTMAVFDNLIHNFDRNHGNQLVDRTGKIWFIDHTRSFPRRPELVSPDALTLVRRDFWERLRELSPERLEAALGPWIDPVARRAILVRRDLIVDRLENRIRRHGAGSVLLEPPPSPPPGADP